MAWPDVPADLGLRGSLASSDEVSAIETELAFARARVAASVRALGDEVARVSDWRAWVRGHVGLALGVAFALGFLSGSRRGPTVTINARRR